MVTTINTRIRQRLDTFTNWLTRGVELLPGEIAIVRISDLSDLPANTKDVVKAPAVLMKVGEASITGGTKSFSELPWLSAKASDVYDWAKTERAEDISISVVTGSGTSVYPVSDTLSNWLKTINNKATANAAQLASTSANITAALEALDSVEEGTGNFVLAVTQTDGKVTVTKGNITDADIPEIMSSKIIVAAGSNEQNKITLDTKIENIDAEIAALRSLNAGHTDEQINELINTKVSTLNAASPVIPSTGTTTALAFIDDISQTNGLILATKKALPLGAEGGVAKHDDLINLSAAVSSNTSNIESISAAIAGGVHFIGTLVAPDLSKITDPSNAAWVIATVTIEGLATPYTAAPGDIVIQGDKEYIWTGNHWKELGDLSRVGALETKVQNLNISDLPVEHNFITAVSQAEGQVSIQRARPTAANVSYGSGSVSDELDSQGSRLAITESKLEGVDESVISTIANEIDKLVYAGANDTSETATSFIDNITQTQGVITATKKVLPTATSTVAGITTLDAVNGAVSYSTFQALEQQITTDVLSRVAAINSNYLRFDGDEESLFIGEDGSDEVIFDCGGAPADE